MPLGVIQYEICITYRRLVKMFNMNIINPVFKPNVQFRKNPDCGKLTIPG